MSVEYKELAYKYDYLSPYLSEETMKYHHGKHYKTYVEKLNTLIEGTDFDSLSLTEIIAKADGINEFRPIFNNAAQVWNHEFYWSSMSREKNEIVLPTDSKLESLINSNFGSLQYAKDEMKNKAVNHFGSGWMWLVYNASKNNLEIVCSSNADNFIGFDNLKPLITIDVWEHAYYLDYQNKRLDYVNAFFDNVVNFKFASDNLNKHLS